jgi:hypothetical protein
MFSLTPAHSTAFVNTSAPARITAKLVTRRTTSIDYATKKAIARIA